MVATGLFRCIQSLTRVLRVREQWSVTIFPNLRAEALGYRRNVLLPSSRRIRPLIDTHAPVLERSAWIARNYVNVQVGHMMSQYK